MLSVWSTGGCTLASASDPAAPSRPCTAWGRGRGRSQGRGRKERTPSPCPWAHPSPSRHTPCPTGPAQGEHSPCPTGPGEHSPCCGKVHFSVLSRILVLLAPLCLRAFEVQCICVCLFQSSQKRKFVRLFLRLYSPRKFRNCPFRKRCYVCQIRCLANVKLHGHNIEHCIMFVCLFDVVCMFVCLFVEHMFV